MKVKNITQNNRRLAEYYELHKTKEIQKKKKLTFVVSEHYAELLAKLSLLLGNSKTQTIILIVCFSSTTAITTS